MPRARARDCCRERTLACLNKEPHHSNREPQVRGKADRPPGESPRPRRRIRGSEYCRERNKLSMRSIGITDAIDVQSDYYLKHLNGARLRYLARLLVTSASTPDSFAS